jgi:uncharacterized protein (TIGR02453 family)
MISNRPANFNGFLPESIVFLKALKKQNNKLWFEAHKHEYEKHVLEPMQRLASSLGPFMLAIDPLFEARPSVNRTISRIYRDTRFSRDKAPYKTTMWITFKRPGEGWQDRPAYFFELASDSYRYGMGFYAASKDTMDALRETIGRKRALFRKTVSFLRKRKDFIVEGETYKRTLKKDESQEILNWYQRKNIYLVRNRKIDGRLFSKQLEKDLRSGFKLLAPLYRFFGNLSQASRRLTATVQ